MNWKRIVLIVLGLVSLACLLACGFFGMKVVRRIRLRREAMTAYGNKDYVLAERLLQQYVSKDPNAEAEFAALANIYREFGNVGMEAQMWQTASSLDPMNPEYRENILTSAVKSASYPLLHGILGRMAKVDEAFTDQELYLYVISSFRSGYPKDGDDAYQKAVKADPEVFHKNELGRLAEYMATSETLSEGERDAYLSRAIQSDDPVIRFEALYTSIRRMEQRDADEAEYERMLDQLVETNYYAGTPLLADYCFSKCRFGDVIDVLDPYLETIDDIDLYLLYAESCVFTGKLDKLETLEKKLRRKTGFMPLIADYCRILIAYLENDGQKLVSAVRKSGKIIDSSLSRFIRLRVAMINGSFNEIQTVAKEIFASEPFHDLHNRALYLCLDSLANEMQKPENRKDPSRIVDLARTLAMYLQGNRMLTEILLMDQYMKGLVKEADLMAALEEFPDDALLRRITTEYLLFNGKPEQALSVLEPVLTAAEETEENPSFAMQSLHLQILDLLGRRDEAVAVFRELVEQSEFDPDLLNQFFRYCVKNKREEDLISMADTLDAVKDGKLEHFGKFFRAAALLASEDEGKKNEALDLLASTPTESPDFMFYAANRLCEYGRLDEAEAKYEAILKTYGIPALVQVNLSNIYHAKGEERKALEAAKAAFDMEKESMLPAFVYAKRLSEAGRYQEAVDTLKFPRYAVNYREDVVELWIDSMHHVIEKSVADRRYLLAEEQCKYLLMIAPDDAFGRETLEKVREILNPKKDESRPGETGGTSPAASAA